MKKIKFLAAVIQDEESAAQPAEMQRYVMEVPEEIYEELYQVWNANDCNIDSQKTNWEGHEALLSQITAALPDGAVWELSPETDDEFNWIL